MSLQKNPEEGKNLKLQNQVLIKKGQKKILDLRMKQLWM